MKVLLICLFILISIILVVYKNVDINDEMENKSKELFKLSAEMTSKKCKTNSMIKNYETLLQVYNNYQNVTNISKEITDKFNTTFLNYKSSYDMLQDCKSYCVNGQYEQKTASCICPNDKPIPFLYKDKTYCLTSSQLANVNQPGFFENLKFEPSVIYDEEKETLSPKNASTYKVYGKYTKDNNSVYVLSQSSVFNHQQPVILKEKTSKDVNECILECISNKDATSFVYDGDKCTLFSNKNVSLNDFSSEGSYIVGTKTPPI